MVLVKDQWVSARDTAVVMSFVHEQELRLRQERRRALRWRGFRQWLRRSIRNWFTSRR